MNPEMNPKDIAKFNQLGAVLQLATAMYGELAESLNAKMQINPQEIIKQIQDTQQNVPKKPESPSK